MEEINDCCGTTIIGIVLRGRIPLAGDGRKYCLTTNLIERGDFVKIFKIHEKFIASFSGRQIGEVIIRHVKETLEKGPRENVTRNRIQQECKGYIASLGKEYDAALELTNIIIAGFDDNIPNARVYYPIQDRYETCGYKKIIGNGSGFEVASEYIDQEEEDGVNKRRRIEGEDNEEELAEHYFYVLNRAIAIAALHDQFTGGHITVAQCSRLGAYTFEKKNHVLHVLRNNYDKLQSYLSRVLLVVTEQMAYNFDNEFIHFYDVVDVESDQLETTHVLAASKQDANKGRTIVRVVNYGSNERRSSSKLLTGFPGHESDVMKLTISGQQVLFMLPTKEHLDTYSNIIELDDECL